jgi:anthranilate 1,2-dioxygenase large subunit
MEAGPSVLDRIQWPSEDNRVPREVYLDQEIYDLEMERIFCGPYWIVVGHEAEIPNPGDYKRMDMGSVPVIVLRDMEGEIRVLVNACAHRGTQLVDAEYGNLAQTKSLLCIYHAWRFALNGDLLAATNADGFPVDFDKERYGLPKARVTVYKGAIFATLSDDAPDFVEHLGQVIDGVDRALGDGKLEYLGAQKTIIEANWKILAENIYDGYHVVALHKAFRLLNIRAAGGDQTFAEDYETSGHGWQEYRTIEPEEVPLLRDASVLQIRTKDEPTNRIMNIWPLSVISDQVDTLSIRFMIPRGPERTEIHYAVFGRAGDSEDIKHHRAVQGSNLFGPEGFVSLEDQTALARVQTSATARGENVVLRGTLKRFPPYRLLDEAGIRHFYSAYRHAMGFRLAGEGAAGSGNGATPTAAATVEASS